MTTPLARPVAASVFPRISSTCKQSSTLAPYAGAIPTGVWQAQKTQGLRQSSTSARNMSSIHIFTANLITVLSEQLNDNEFKRYMTSRATLLVYAVSRLNYRLEANRGRVLAAFTAFAASKTLCKHTVFGGTDREMKQFNTQAEFAPSQSDVATAPALIRASARCGRRGFISRGYRPPLFILAQHDTDQPLNSTERLRPAC